ncbi:glycoside hydrolase family 3 N-terminal domain-containing protein [Pleomorphovibrio marinus]|uniref:glycoside hydrolase family 3 N-terminal domain-containing protein n=1 Tax=Pleomorphovibrio marinus TaxID=2164132 RepID=UPI001E529F4D|nr:glycoside hydrolase family 3 N-terminal domain-containing protein [Pleomorphovibrio marinus]
MVFLTLVSCLTIGWTVTVAGFNPPDPLLSLDQSAQQHWVDSVFNSMSFEERLGQLFMVAAYSNRDHRHREEISRLVKEEKLGGLIFFQGGPVRQAHLVNHYQSLSQVPLFLAMDAEWGPGMRLDSVLQFPKQMTLGAGGNDRLVYEMGKEIARQFKEMGMHINFAPVVDVNSNPDNPVIGYRAFGEEKKLVSRKSMAYMRGMQDHGIMANAKHFPGHGDTNLDSHYTTPVIHNSREYIHDIDLYPYRELIDNGLMSVMVAHLHVPSLGSEARQPTTLSPKVVTELLKDDLGFKGLIFTDALNMKGVSNLYPPGEVDLMALKAGNDVLLYAEDVPKSKALIMKAVGSGEISEDEIDLRVRKILAAKYWAGLHRKTKVNPDKLVERVSNFGTKALIEQLYANSITVVKNAESIVPIRNLDLRNMASVSLGSRGEVFKEHLDKYGKFTHYTMRGASGPANYKAMEENLKSYNTIVVGVMGMSNNPKRNFGVQASDLEFIKRLNEKHNVITVVFGNAYGAGLFQDLPNLVLAYEENDFTEKLVPQVLFGARPATGTLPVTIGEKLLIGSGEQLSSVGRLAYSTPENQGMDSRRLMEIDHLMENAIRKKATPGGTVLVAKNGHVVFEKSYGHVDYEKSNPVTPKTLFDLASLTKVLSTTQMMMFLHGRGLIEMDRPIGDYLHELQGTNKSHLKLGDIMTHEAGLVGWIPHYSLTMMGKEWKPGFYNTEKSEEFPYPIADGIWGKRSLPDSVWHWTLQSDLRRTGKLGNSYTYLYSDVGMYLLHRMIETMIGQPINEFMRQNFYEPLGLNRMGYLPLERFDKAQIAPTEVDRIFRRTLVHGHVHDPGAALYGGVAGHAGLFGTAHDVAVIMQMMLQEGDYGGLQLLEEETVSAFTEKKSLHSRRGWGWDKPEPDVEKRGAVGKLASKNTFGHTGFTGTAAWADPDQGLVYVFLSNRVYPDASNNLINKDKLRGAIHDVIYRSISQPLLLANK